MKTTRWLKIFLFFITFFFYKMGPALIIRGSYSNIFVLITYFIFQFIFIYFNFYYVFKKKVKGVEVILSGIKLLIIFCSYLIFFYIFLFQIVNKIIPNYFTQDVKDDFFFIFLEYYLEFLMISIAYALYKKAVNNGNLLRQKEQELFEKEKHNLELQIQNQALEKQKIEAEYNYLRTQINPHFLYNTLGFFYSKVAVYDATLAEEILKLTNIMRYTLHKGDELGRVPLSHEIENLEDYLSLQQLRFGDQLKLEYHKEITQIEELKILPHLMLTLVENAFKHGNNFEAYQPLTIQLQFDKDTLYCRVTNLINKAKHQQPTTHTGLLNLRSRLQSVYPNKHQYIVSTTDTTYTVTMNIQLNTNADIITNTIYDSTDAYINQTPPSTSSGFNIAALF